MEFSSPLSALNNNHDINATLNNTTSSSTAAVQPNHQQQQQQPLTNNHQQPITLDPTTLNNISNKQGGTSYANVKMMNANNLSELQDKICSNNTANSKQTPFTIQGFNDRYNLTNENHSEISC